MKAESPESQTLKGVVRGERAWSELADIGITVRASGDAIEVRNPRQLSVAVDAKDLSAGILRYKHDPVKVREWATLVLADAISCELRLKEEGEEQALLDVMWDLSFGKGLSPQGLELAQRFAQRKA